jgi:hypothetical protein
MVGEPASMTAMRTVPGRWQIGGQFAGEQGGVGGWAVRGEGALDEPAGVRDLRRFSGEDAPTGPGGRGSAG